jgi:hypothetical protein
LGAKPLSFFKKEERRKKKEERRKKKEERRKKKEERRKKKEENVFLYPQGNSNPRFLREREMS